MANNLLGGNIYCEPANSIHGEFATHNSTVYLPKLNRSKINSMLINEATRNNKIAMDIFKVKLMALTTSIQHIGKIKDVTDVTHMLVNAINLVPVAVKYGTTKGKGPPTS